mgnify:CR=1
MPSDTHQVWGGLDWHANRPGHPLGGWKTTAQIREGFYIACSIVGEQGSFTMFFRPKLRAWRIPCATYKQAEGESHAAFAKRLAEIFTQVVTGLGS